MDGRRGDGSDEVQVVRGYCLAFSVSYCAGRVGEKREWEREVCVVCKIDSSLNRDIKLYIDGMDGSD